MKIPIRLVERITDKLTKELTEKEYIEAEDIEKFKENILQIIKNAIQEEKDLEKEAEELVEQHKHLLEEEDINFRNAVRKVKEKLAEERNIHLDPEERMNQVAHKIRKYIEEDDSIEIFVHPNKIRKLVFAVLKDLVREEKEIDREVRNRIRSYSRKIYEGTTEWKILYNKIYEDILKRKGLI